MAEIISENKRNLLEIQEVTMDLFSENLQNALDKSDKRWELTIEKIDNKKIKIVNKNWVVSDLVLDFSAWTCRLAYWWLDTFSLYIKNDKINPEKKKIFDIHTWILDYVAKLQNAIYREYEEKNFIRWKYIEVPWYKDDDETFYIINLTVTLETKKKQEELDQNIIENLDKKD